MKQETQNEISYFCLLRRQFQYYLEIRVVSSQGVKCWREGVWTHLRSHRSNRGNNTQLTKQKTQQLKLTIFCFTPPSIPAWHWNPCFFITRPLMPKVSGLTQGVTEVIAAIIHDWLNKNTLRTDFNICLLYPAVLIPSLHWNPCFFNTRRLMLPRRCLESLMGATEVHVWWFMLVAQGS